MSVDLAQLLAADHQTACENPPTFDYELAMSKVVAIRPQLEEIIGCQLEMDTSIQDASFFTELALFQQSPDKPNVRQTTLGIRFSCFGDFVTVWSNGETDAETSVEWKIIELLEQAGYKFVSPTLLDHAYDGKNIHLQGLASWWHRYFDYF